MFMPLRWLRIVVVALGLVLLLSASPVINGNGQVAEAVALGVLGECGDGSCGYMAR